LSRVDMDLYCGTAGWALPCVDPLCTAVVALLRAHDLPFTLHLNQAASMTALHELPALYEHAPPPGSSAARGKPANTPTIAGFGGVQSFLRSQRLIDWSLTRAQLAECDAFCALITSSIAPLELYERMLNDDNYLDYTRPLIASAFTFPSSWILPMRERSRVRALLSESVGLHDDTRVRNAKLDAMYDAAERSLAHLSARLGSLAFGAGSEKMFYSSGTTGAVVTSSLDAVLFGHLAAILYSPFDESRLRDLVAAQPVLVSFCHRMRARHFPECEDYDFENPVAMRARLGSKSERSSAERAAREAADQASRERARQAAGSSSVPVDPQEQARKRRNQIFVAACFLLYALDFVEFDSVVLE